jgi:hypothetical protein
MHLRQKQSCAIILGFAISAGAGIGHAGPGKSPQSDDNPFISSKSHATNPKVYGKTYGEWAAEWWKWAASFPADMNPIGDETGELCDMGQSGPVWFLAGTFGATDVERDCTIPPGKAIFYPIVNAAWVDAPGDEVFSDDEVRWIVSALIGDTWCQLSSTLDTFDTPNLGEVAAPVTALGRPIVRAQSPKDSVYLPEDNIFDDPENDVDIPGGLNNRLIAEGHWVMLPPLTPGDHVLKLHGAVCAPALDESVDPPTPIFDENGEQLIEKTFETEVTYFLSVGP